MSRSLQQRLLLRSVPIHTPLRLLTIHFPDPHLPRLLTPPLVYFHSGRLLPWRRPGCRLYILLPIPHQQPDPDRTRRLNPQKPHDLEVPPLVLNIRPVA